MARRRYFRYYPRTRVAKKKWATNYKTFTINTSSDIQYTVLCENKVQANAPTPTIIKTGNYKVQGDCGISNASPSTPGVVYLRAFIVFVPEGWGVDDASVLSIPTTHPEWIMAWCALDVPVAAAASAVSGNKFSLSSRLKRNLNSGDKVVFFIDDLGTSTSLTANVNAAAQYWTCAN